MAEKFNNFEKFEHKKTKSLVLFSTQRPPDVWTDASDHLPIGLVANKYTNLEKRVKPGYLVRGCPI